MVAPCLYDPLHQCKHPTWPHSKTYIRPIYYAVTCLWVLGICGLIAAGYIMIRGLMADTTNYNVNSPEFPLYKNTDFKNCSSIALGKDNCTEIFEILDDYKKPHYLYDQSMKGDGTSPMEYSWCTAVRCFKDYKVVPSEAYPSAVVPNGFSILASFNMATISTLWLLRGYLADVLKYQYKGKPRKPCQRLKSLGVIDWIFNIYDFCGPFVWWWVSFFRAALNPTNWNSMSFAAWTVTFCHAIDMRYHPYRCVLDRHPALKEPIKGIVYLLTLSQWAATLYSIYIWIPWTLALTTIPGYKCLEDQIASAPGTTSCSAAQICSKEFLFASFRASYSGEFFLYDWAWIIYTIHFAVSTLAVLLSAIPFIKHLYWNISGRHITEEQRNKERNKGMKGFFVLLALFTIISIYANIILLTGFFKLWDPDARFGTVAYDKECHAVHVSFSAGRHYFDVDDMYRPWWLAKAWLNA
ncbi:hypothetical protein FDECE_9275 [Fusarium decemcellulare]|nr:hypothetical protein FDECE_9275 [Fusarium decemcellulare]